MALRSSSSTGKRPRKDQHTFFEDKLLVHWEASSGRTPDFGFGSSSSRNYQASCRQCGYSASPQTFYSLHAQAFCRKYEASCAVGIKSLALFKTLHLSKDWRDDRYLPAQAPSALTGTLTSQIADTQCTASGAVRGGLDPAGAASHASGWCGVWDIIETSADAEREAARLAQHVMLAAKFLDDEMWVPRAAPMVAALILWHHGGPAPDHCVHQEFQAAMSSLDACINVKKQQHTVQNALSCMRTSTALTEEHRRRARGE